MAHAATSDRRSHLVMRRALSGLAPWIERLARLGFLARGLVYVLIGVLAIRVAFGLGRRYADAGGVLRVLLAEPFGRVLLVVVAAGLLGFAAWQAAAAVFDLERQGARFSGWLARVGYAVSAFVHLALGVDALRLVVATRPGRSIDPVHYWTVRALSALSPKLRAVVVLSFYARLTREEIARILKVPPGTVASRQNSAMEIMRRTLADPADPRKQEGS